MPLPNLAHAAPVLGLLHCTHLTRTCERGQAGWDLHTPPGGRSLGCQMATWQLATMPRGQPSHSPTETHDMAGAHTLHCPPAPSSSCWQVVLYLL
jgi:hypothetical protein